MAHLKSRDYAYYTEDFESSVQKKECYDIANELINDVRGSDTRTMYIKSVLQGDFNTEKLDQIIKLEDDKKIEEQLRALVQTAETLHPEERKAIYDNLMGFDTYDKYSEYQDSIYEEKHFTSKKILAELTDGLTEEFTEK